MLFKILGWALVWVPNLLWFYIMVRYRDDL